MCEGECKYSKNSYSLFTVFFFNLQLILNLLSLPQKSFKALHFISPLKVFVYTEGNNLEGEIISDF